MKVHFNYDFEEFRNKGKLFYSYKFIRTFIIIPKF